VDFGDRSVPDLVRGRVGDAGVLKPDKPTDNAFIEAFNSKVRAECL